MLQKGFKVMNQEHMMEYQILLNQVKKIELRFKILVFTTQHNVLVFHIEMNKKSAKPKSFDIVWSEVMFYDKHKLRITYYIWERHVKPTCNIYEVL